MALVPDHYLITVAARRDGPGGTHFFEHQLSIELPLTTTKGEARTQFNDTCRKYPEPAYEVELKHIVCRSSPVLHSKRDPVRGSVLNDGDSMAAHGFTGSMPSAAALLRRPG